MSTADEIIKEYEANMKRIRTEHEQRMDKAFENIKLTHDRKLEEICERAKKDFGRYSLFAWMITSVLSIPVSFLVYYLLHRFVF